MVAVGVVGDGDGLGKERRLLSSSRGGGGYLVGGLGVLESVGMIWDFWILMLALGFLIEK